MLVTERRFVTLNAAIACLILFLFCTSITTSCVAEDVCENSTVEDAWGPTFATQAKAFLKKLQDIVKGNDEAQLALLVHYPLRFVEGNRQTYISSSTQFVRKYSSIMTPEVKKAIIDQSTSCLFANGDGVMIGRGQVWFQKESRGQMKIITINPSAPTPGAVTTSQ